MKTAANTVLAANSACPANIKTDSNNTGAMITAAANDDDKPLWRTAEQNAGGREPAEIIEMMLQGSREIGEPVTLRMPITPAMATYLLSLNPNNRKLKPAKIDQYKRDLLAGRWQENGEGLAIADFENGALNNGQHRTKSIAETGVTVVMNLTVGVTRESRNTVDIGTARTPADILSMNGYANSKPLASLARYVNSYESTDRKSIGAMGAVTATEVQVLVKNNPDAIAAVEFATTCGKGKRTWLSNTIIAFIRYYTHRQDPTLSDRFFEGILTGAEKKVGLNVDDPRYAARSTLMAMIYKQNISGRMAVMMRAWNSFKNGGVYVSGRIQVVKDYPKFA